MVEGILSSRPPEHFNDSKSIIFHFVSIPQMALDKLIARERRLAHRNRNSELLAELRKPHEDMSILQDEKEVMEDFPELQRVPNMKLTGQAFSDLLMVFEFLHNFGETLGFGEYSVIDGWPRRTIQ